MKPWSLIACRLPRAMALLECSTGSIPKRQGTAIAGREVLPHQEALAKQAMSMAEGSL